MDQDNLSSISVKNELEVTWDHMTEGIGIRIKWYWYEHSEKSTKYFLNPEKQRGSQNIIKICCS